MKTFVLAMAVLYAIVGVADFIHLIRSDYPRERPPWTRQHDGLGVVLSAAIVVWAALLLTGEP